MGHSRSSETETWLAVVESATVGVSKSPRPASGNARINEDSRESWVENSELGQDEGGQTIGTSRAACWSSSIANWNNCLTVMFVLPDSSTSASAMVPILVQELREELQDTSEGISIGGSLTTDELKDGSTGARMSCGTRAEQQLQGTKNLLVRGDLLV